jgi:opacity protein-like surface antigen
MEGWLAGLQVGYRHQMGAFVFGAEISGSVAAISDTGVTEIYDNIMTELDEFGGIYEGTMDINWLVLAQAKLGFALTDDFLVSATGGLAWAGTEFSSSAGYSDDKVAQGFTVGAQADFKIDDNVSIFGAYNYSWFDDVTYEGNSLFGLIANYHEYDLALHTIKVGINYQLD